MSFASGTNWLRTGVSKFAGETATLRRGPHSVEITVIRHSSQPRLYTADGQSYVELVGQDFLIAPSEYQVNGTEEKPLPGDRLILGDEQYVVAPIVAGEAAWVWSDQSHTFYKVHTQVEEV